MSSSTATCLPQDHIETLTQIDQHACLSYKHNFPVKWINLLEAITNLEIYHGQKIAGKLTP